MNWDATKTARELLEEFRKYGDLPGFDSLLATRLDLIHHEGRLAGTAAVSSALANQGRQP